MTSTTQRIYEKALTLPDTERADLAALLIESLDTRSDSSVEQAWRDEVGRRIAAVDSGQARLIPWEEAEAMIFGDGDGLVETSS